MLKIIRILLNYIFFYSLSRKYNKSTMVKTMEYIDSLYLTYKYSVVEGSIVECGVWKGGMSLGMIDITLKSNKRYHFFDSFAGLPPAESVDGKSAVDWKSNTAIQENLKNCEADLGEFKSKVKAKGIDLNSVFIYPGFFENTLINFPNEEKISVLRLDADWYKSTIECLDALYDSVQLGGVIIIDDYHTWDGCSRAIHDFLSKRELSVRVRQTRFGGVAFIVKQ